MLEAFAIDTTQNNEASFEVLLTYEERKKSRYKTATVSGQPLGWFLERGHVLVDGDLLLCSDGSRVKVIAAQEAVSEVHTTDSLQLTRAAYHLGNRHVPLQIGENFLRYQHDHVLDGMVRGLGLEVTCENKPFHPESGAYRNHLHSQHEH